ncbi:MAG TPA: hypothetical protein VGB71_12350 [Flavisolibacter sp.]
MKKYTSLLNIFLLAVLLISSCKKEHAPNGRSPINNTLEVRLHTSYLPASKIDSAILIWEAAGQTKRQKFLFSGDTLRLLLKQFNSGQGRMAIQLYTQVKLQGHKLQFEKRWEFSLSHHQPIVTPGPADLNDPDWTPRVIIQEKEWTGLTAIIGLRPTDPYFAIRNIPERWPLIGLGRSYYKKLGGQLVAEKIWNNDGTNRQVIEDRTYFLPLAGEVADTPWGWINIDLDIFSHTENTSFSLSFGSPR